METWTQPRNTWKGCFVLGRKTCLFIAGDGRKCSQKHYVIVIPWASRVYGVCTLRAVLCIPEPGCLGCTGIVYAHNMFSSGAFRSLWKEFARAHPNAYMHEISQTALPPTPHGVTWLS